jgi:hypothetical protein
METTKTSRAGKWRFLYGRRGTLTYWIRHIGHVSVCWITPKTANNPSDRPWHLVNVGTTHETPEDALACFFESCDKSPEVYEDRSYERAEALMCGPGRFEEP